MPAKGTKRKPIKTNRVGDGYGDPKITTVNPADYVKRPGNIPENPYLGPSK